jgi:hypothetical protein
MGVFFSDWCGPGQIVVEPRKNIRLYWFYYTDNASETENVLQYFKVYWKPTTVKGWTDPLVKSVIVDKSLSWYDLPPNTFTLDSAWAWRVEALVQDRDYDPEIPPGDPNYVSPDFFVQSENSMVVDTSGYTLYAERNGVVASGNQGFGYVGQKDIGFFRIDPSDPGQYEVRFKVSNGFQWSAYSTPVTLVQYDTNKWVKKGGYWNAVPVWKKQAGTFIKTN